MLSSTLASRETLTPRLLVVSIFKFKKLKYDTLFLYKFTFYVRNESIFYFFWFKCGLIIIIETATKTGMVMVLGEITTSSVFDYQKVIRDTIKDIGYTDSSIGNGSKIKFQIY